MKEYLESLYRSYHKVLEMTEEEVMHEYGACKSEIISDYEREIDGYEKEESDRNMEYDFDIAFSSWVSVNSMFI